LARVKVFLFSYELLLVLVAAEEAKDLFLGHLRGRSDGSEKSGDRNHRG
jgi:hypothetical protein